MQEPLRLDEPRFAETPCGESDMWRIGHVTQLIKTKCVAVKYRPPGRM